MKNHNLRILRSILAWMTVVSGLDCCIFVRAELPSVRRAVDDETVLLMHFDGKDMAERLKDEAAHHNHGEAHGDFSASAEGGRFGDALHFDVGRYVLVPHSASLAIDDDFTVEFWIYPDALPGFLCGLVGKGRYQIDGWHMALLSSGKIVWSMNQNGTNQNVVSFADITPKKWHHVLAIKNGSTGRIFINGSDRTESSQSLMPPAINTQGVCVGRLNPGGKDPNAYYFKGLIDELCISKKAGLCDAKARTASFSNPIFGGQSLSGKEEITGIHHVEKGRNTLKIKVSNKTAAGQKLDLKGVITGPLGASASFGRKIEMRPGETRQVNMEYEPAECGRNRLVISLFDSISEVHSACYHVQVSPLLKIRMDRSYYTTEREARIGVKMGERVKMGEGWTWMIEVKNLAGRLIERRIAPPPGKRMLNLSVPLEKLPEGAYVIKAGIRDKNNADVETDSVIFHKHKPVVGEVKVTGRNSFLVDGKAFLPIGWFTAAHMTTEEDFKAMADAGFNLVMGYFFRVAIPETVPGSMEDFPVMKSYLDNARKNGMKVILSVTPFLPVQMKKYGFGDDMGMKYYRAVISIFREHPALFGWWIADEPEFHGVTGEELLEIGRTTKSLDPHHLVFVCNNLADVIPIYSEATDVVVTNDYPVDKVKYPYPMDSLDIVSDNVRKAVGYVDDEKPVIYVTQAFDPGLCDGRWKKGVSHGYPTPWEIRCMSYLSVINGARGLLWFIYHSADDVKTYWRVRDHRELWGECSKIAGEFKRLSSVIEAGEDSRTEMAGMTDGIDVSMRQAGDQLYLMAANRKNGKIRAQLKTMPVKSGAASVLFENRKINFDGGILEDEFDGFAVHLYEIKMKKEAEICQKN
ncbi:MAG: LamG domain-containing protein [Verrucomicrobiae bacterium]|nr:LamG domain-containing protein [Verrucomicrobiae bacterium]